MPRLALYLFGPPRVELDGEPVHIPRRKALALLAYLAVARPRLAGQGHSRDTLASLLWPEYGQRRARANLRNALLTLNRSLGTEWLTADNETVSLNPRVDSLATDGPSASGQVLWVDVDQFRQRLAACKTNGHPATDNCPDCAPLLKEAVALYHDHFLAGFTLPDSPSFDEFQLVQAEALKGGLAGALEQLIHWHSTQGGRQYEQAIAYAKRWLALNPLNEPAHRCLMVLYAQSGQRTAALRQYETCCRLLAEELDVEPEEETIAQCEQIKAGEIPHYVIAPPSLPHPPTFLTAEKALLAVERPVFVARERELARLDGYLAAALTGQSQVVFVTGGPGRGKTALIHGFARRAMDAYPDLRVAEGSCNAYSGVGDPYLPFRGVMAMLTGDVEARWTAGTITRDHAWRLWDGLPCAAQALVDHGPALIGTLVLNTPLLTRAVASIPGGAACLKKLRTFSEQERTGRSGMEQRAMFEQYTNVLRALAAQFPLLLLVDDMQWADTASASLLFHLGRRLEGARVLIVGAYRPEEIALGRDGGRHPLEEALNEFKCRLGNVWVDLTRTDEIEGRRFGDAYLDTEPNRLGGAFRETLFRRTRGHPLFTVELLRAMQERSDLVQDGKDYWIEGSALDWESLPARVEAVIEARVSRLTEELRAALAVASVEGEWFTAQVIARVQSIPERKLVRMLSQELGIRHRLVREGEEVQVDGHFLSRYQFSHALFQEHLYSSLSSGERRLLHGEVAMALEALYGSRTDEIMAQLEHHYTAAGLTEKAIEYSVRAGDQARLAYAHLEAIRYYRRALSLLKGGGEHERMARTLMKLGLAYDLAFDFRQARQAYEEGFAAWQMVRDVEGKDSPPAPHALRLCGGEPLTLDPTRNINRLSARMISQLFSGLVDVGSDKGVVPDVAQSWEMLEGGRKFVFHLRDDVHWSDGTPVTAMDFEYAWKRVLDPALGIFRGTLLYDVKGARIFHQGETLDPANVGIRSLDEVTLEVKLERPTSYSLLLLAGPLVVPRHVVEEHGDAWTEVENIVTNGPFRLEAWQWGESLVLVRNPEYHGQFPGNLQRVELQVWTDEWEWSTTLAMYEADRLDTLGLEGTPAQRDAARQRHAAEYVSLPNPATFYVGFRVMRPPFDDVRVRQAFALATDRETMVDEIAGSYVSPATGGLIPPEIPGHSPGIALPYDPDQAQQLLAQAGYPGGRGFPDVDALVCRDDNVRWIESLQAQWRENLGIEIHWEAVDVVTHEDKLPTEEFDLFLEGWVGDIDPGSFARKCQGLYNAQYQNVTYYRLVEKANQAIDPKERGRLYGQADRLLMEDAAIVPLLYFRRHLLVKPWVKPKAAVGEWRLKDVVIEPH